MAYFKGVSSQCSTMDGGTTEADHWREVAAQKEKEWKQVTEQR